MQAAVLWARTSERRHGPVRDEAPHLEGSEEGQGGKRGTRCMYDTASFRKRALVHARGSRPPCLGEPRRPQERIQQRTMEQLADVVPMVQILGVPVPQMVEDTLMPVPEQVIEVPKIFPDDVPVRTAVRVEQLVEVSTIVSFSSLQRILEQTVDIPVPEHGGRLAGLQGFPPEQSSTAFGADR